MPPDPRPDPDACILLSAMDLEPLLLAGADGPRNRLRRGARDRVSPRPQPLATQDRRALIALLVLDLLFAGELATTLIDRYGQTSAGIVTGSFATATQYNHREVVGYRVLIGTAEGRTEEAAFRTDDFNVRGLNDTSLYPGVGDFVIRNDDQSPWARKLACGRLAAWRAKRRDGRRPLRISAACVASWPAPPPSSGRPAAGADRQPAAMPASAT